MVEQAIINTTRADSFVAQIQDHFRLQIRHGELHPGEKLPSMRELSANCGVSLGIVKQALNTLVTEGYLRSHPGRGVFVSTSPLTRKKIISLVLPSFNVEQMAQIARGVKEGLAQESGQLMMQAADSDFDQEMDLVANLDTRLVAGAIIYPPPLNSYRAPLEELRRRGIPYVLVDTFFDALPVDAVASDRVMLGRLAFEHLIEHGHRHIGVIDSNADATSAMQVREGAQQALGKAGLRYEQLPRVCGDSRKIDADNPWLGSQLKAMDLLAQHPRITALVGMNDNMAMGAFRAAKASGRRVPQDISVIAVGDLPAFQATEPTVTAVAQGHRAMGRLAAMRLMELLNEDRGSRRPGPRRVRVKPQLRVRGSVSLSPEACALRKTEHTETASM